MNKSKLISGLKTLEKSEFRRFKEFVHSPYHNKNKHVMGLVDHFGRLFPEFKREKLDRIIIYDALFPKRESKNLSKKARATSPDQKELKVRHLMSMLLKLLEEFLVLEARKKAPKLDHKVALLKEYRRRDLGAHFSSTLKEAEKMEATVSQDLQYYYLRYLLEVEKDEFKKLEKGRSENLQAVSIALDEYYLANKLRQSCVLVNHQNMFQEHFDIKMLDGVLGFLAKEETAEPLIRLYYSALLSLQDPENESHFFALKEGLEQAERIDPQEGKELHTLARNYCIKRLNKGNRAYLKELFELYQLAIQQSILSDIQGHFPASAFKNIVTIGLRLGEKEWVFDFISTYANELDQRIRETYRGFNLAKYHYETGEFRKVVSLLNQIPFEDPFIQLDARILLLKCYFELGEIDLLEALLNSFSMLISRHKILGYHRENYQNIVGFTRKVLGLAPRDEKERVRLRGAIEGTEVLTEKAWLLEKLEEN